MPNQYPLVILPQELYLIKEETPPLPPIPTEPQKPKLKELKEPIEPSKPMSFSQAWGCSILAIAAFILIIYWGRNSDFVGEMFENAPGFLLLIFFATPVIAIITIYSYHNNAEKEKFEYEKRLKIYAEEIRQFNYDKINYKKDYESQLNDYNQIIYPNYLESVRLYAEKKEQILKHNNIHKYRMSLLKNFFKSVKEPTLISNPYLTGVSEEQFYNTLKSYDSNFYKSYSLIDGEDLQSYYVPDIVYFNKTTGMVIDIEVDEPYLGADGTPIHYEGYDDIRNKFFQKKGWIVIRFTEEQVVKSPTQCYEFIKKVVAGILIGKLEIDYSAIERFPQWTKDEGHKLAFSRYRNKYLKSNLIEKILEERLIEKRNSNFNY